MTDLNHFEDEIRGMLADVEGRAELADGFADRLVAGVTGAARATPPHQVGTLRTLGRRSPRWLPPLLAAAAVIVVVAGGAAVVNTVSADRGHPATQVPTSTITGTPTGTPQHTTPPPTTTGIQAPGNAVPAGFVGASAWFRDASNGYVIGNVPCQAKPGYCATLIRTGDGGTHWATVQLPTGLTPVDDKGNAAGGSCGDNGNIYGPCVDKIAFPDPMHGYAWSFHRFYSTNDGGATWTVGRDAGTQDGYARATTMVFSGSQAFRIGPVADCSAGCTYQVQEAAIGSSAWRTVTPQSPKPFQGAALTTAGGTVYLSGGKLTTDGSIPPGSLFRWTGSGWQTITTRTCSLFALLSGASDGTVSMFCDGDRPTFQVLAGGTLGSTRPAPTGTTQVIPISAHRLVAFVNPPSANPVPTTEQESSDSGATWHSVGQVEPWTPVTAAFGYRLGAAGNTIELTTDGGATFQSFRLA